MNYLYELKFLSAFHCLAWHWCWPADSHFSSTSDSWHHTSCHPVL